jgi:(E)-4-hydroxy-3-methylbut-2-enyl-diphosphate synthase
VDAAIARADTTLAEREAAKDRRRNLGERGDDANDSEQRIEMIHKRVESS